MVCITRSDDETPSVITNDRVSYVDNAVVSIAIENIPAEGNIVKKSKEHAIGKH